MANLRVELHPKQTEVFNDNHRFKVVAAGRRFGKSRLAAWTLIIEALKSTEKDVFYVAPTFQQAKDIMWSVLKELGHEVIKSVHENTAVITLVNDRKIYLKGSDRPDTMRGVGLAYVVIDEYADMKPQVFEQILRPALSDVKGGALFIGTPKGRNHFYELYQMAQRGEDEDWSSFHFTSFDNPLLDPKEIEAAKKSMSSFSFRQEYLASFEAAQSDLFKDEWIKYVDSDDLPDDGSYYIAVDLAGFEDVSKQASNKKKHLDETAIAVVKVCLDGWYVDTIVAGRWDIKETANKILETARSYDVRLVGIERGMAKNAVLFRPYIWLLGGSMDYMMEEKEEFVPLNWDSLITNEGVWEVIKEELDKLSPYCMMTIITAAKGEGLGDKQIFKPMTKEVEVEYEELESADPFGDTTKD